MSSGAFFVAALAAFTIAAVSWEASADDAVLARLSRIGKGQWLRPPPTPVHLPYREEIRAAALRHGLSPSLLAALVRVESAFNPRAVSHAGAQGLGQLMPATARSLGVSDPFDPLQNLDGAARYLSAQLRRFGNVRLALAAYNAGPHRAARGLGRVPDETLRYVTLVMRREREYRERGLI